MSQPGQNTHMGSTLKGEEKEVITTILAKNSDLFSWTASDMSGIDPRIITHKLSVCKEANPIAQKEEKNE